MDFRILIVEDELVVAYDIAAALNEEGYPNTRIAKDLASAIEAIDDFNPHLILTDIMLDAKTDGISLGHYIKAHHNVPFIYLTAHGSVEMIREASKSRPNSYLVKPFKTQDLVAAVELALVNSTANNEADKIWIKDGSTLHCFNSSEILLLKAEENYTAVHTANVKPTLVRHSLTSLQKLLPEALFFRTHKSFIINRKHIKNLNQANLVVNDMTIPIGRTYRSILQKTLYSEVLA